MSDDDTQPTSGSRWEQPTPPPVAHPTAPAPAYAPAPQPRHRGKLALAGGAVGIALVAGGGGFALGHATADTDRDGMGRFGPGNLQGNFPDGGPLGPQHNGPQGAFPGQPGQPPDGFGDRDDDGDGDQGQQLPDDGTTEGSTSNS
jgi:hypothetical protein